MALFSSGLAIVVLEGRSITLKDVSLRWIAKLVTDVVHAGNQLLSAGTALLAVTAAFLGIITQGNLCVNVNVCSMVIKGPRPAQHIPSEA